MNNNDKERLAQQYLSDYSLALLPRWEGYKLVWHLWPIPNLAYLATYWQYVERIIEICQEKPNGQIVQRLKSIKLVVAQFDISTWDDARRAEIEAEEALSRANSAKNDEFSCLGEAYEYKDNALGDWMLAMNTWVDEDNAFYIYNAPAIEIAHSNECDCSVCGWNGKEMEFSKDGGSA